MLDAYFANVEGHEGELSPTASETHGCHSGVSLKTLRKIVDASVSSYELLIEDVARRGGGSNEGYALPDVVGEEVEKWVEAELNDDSGPQRVTLPRLQAHIREERGIHMSRKRICKFASVWPGGVSICTSF